MAGKYRLRARQAGVIPVLAAAGILVAACGSSASSGGGSGTGTTPGAAVSSSSVSGVGTVLVNSAGMTIYTPQQASKGLACTGSCLGFWFPVTGKVPPSSSLPGKLATVKRTDGKTQLTYNGKPLYTFKLDSAGQAKGNMFHDSFGGMSFTWMAVTANGHASGGNPAPSPSGGGYSTPGGGY